MKRVQKIGWIIFALTVLSNIIFYPFLPERMAIQFNSSGVSNTAAKPLALLLIPVVILLLNFLYGRNEEKAMRGVILGGVLFILNIVENVINLIIF